MTITHYAPVLGGFSKLIEYYGKDPDPVFTKLGLDPTLAKNPNARIPYAKVEALWAEIIALIDDPYIGLKSAELWHPSSSGALGYAWLASSSLRTAFARIVRYLRFFTEGMECRIEENNDEFFFIHHFYPGSRALPAHTDAILATLTSLCRINYGQHLNPLCVSFTHSTPADTGEYYAFFRCPVLFACADNRITLSREVADKHLRSDNPLLAHMNDQVMLDFLAKLDKNNIIERVKVSIIDQLPSGHISDYSVADSLAMSTRTLQRKLHNNNVSFKSILNEVRRDLANIYIQDSHLSLSEISFLLGFSEISSFSRAFKRWNGTAPSTFRTR